MINKNQNVHLIKLNDYQADTIYSILPIQLFSIISPGDTVVLKPNWVLEEHQYHQGEWEQVITHPDVITAVLRRVVDKLGNKGQIIITDGPELNANFDKILSRQPLAKWKSITDQHNITLKIIDLREELYIQDKNVTIKKLKLKGDPKGKVVTNLLNENSEFYGHKKSPKGYFSAGPDIREANRAHDGHTNLYSISRSVVEADVFINLPKLKTHKKSGITCSLKNLVGINTYRNYLPHNSIGTPSEGGDQFPSSHAKSLIESAFMPFIHQNILRKSFLAKLFSPVIGLGKMVFGDNRQTIRGGSWYGNDTIWRMILDLNKILLYCDKQGVMIEDSAKLKKYISIVDAITAGEGYGPKSPDSKKLNSIIFGNNPVAVDAVCAKIMGFDPIKIPSINHAFNIKHFPIINYTYNDILVEFNKKVYHIDKLPVQCIVKCKPHPGWHGHIEME
jgi:uncharacterized protein (DUF362 family)